MLPPSARALRAVAPLVAAALALTACGSAPSGDDDRPQVQAALYPLAWAAEQVAGDDATVATLAPPGVEPHDVELTPRQVGGLEDAAVVLTVPGLQPAVDDALESVGVGAVVDATEVAAAATADGGRAPGVPPAPTAADLGLSGDLAETLAGEHAADDGHDHALGTGDGGPDDPHVWLDPTALAAVGEATAEALAAADPAAAAAYRERAAALRDRLRDLDAEVAAGLASCDSRVVVVAHEAFGHLARRYGLQQVGVAGLSPEDEPSAARLATVAEVVRQLDAGTVFTAPGGDSAAVETVAAEAGAGTAVLDPVEVQPEEGDYVDAVRADLAALRDALGCA